jgi:hypothetical protein
LNKFNVLKFIKLFQSTQAINIHEQIANFSIIDGMIALYDQPNQEGATLMYQPQEFDQYLNLAIVKWDNRQFFICT